MNTPNTIASSDVSGHQNACAWNPKDDRTGYGQLNRTSIRSRQAGLTGCAGDLDIETKLKDEISSHPQPWLVDSPFSR
jgi:hypothetical protein